MIPGVYTIKTPIKFGTDGWRGVIAEDFTFDNVRLCAQATAEYLINSGLAARGLIIGYDTRFASEDFAAVAAEVIAGNGIRVFLCKKATPTPVISYATKATQAGGAIIITASHNPGRWNGFKLKTQNGTSAPPETTSLIENIINTYSSSSSIKSIALSKAMEQKLVEFVDYTELYVNHISHLIDITNIREWKMKVIIDPMHGAGAGYLYNLLAGSKLNITEIDAERNPLFPGMEQPEPIAQNLKNLSVTVRNSGAITGLATDGDADRFGAVDENGIFLTTLQIYALLAFYLLEIRQERGTIVRTITTTTMLDRLGQIYNVPVIETPVGFKWVASVMEKENALIGGEESGGYGFRGHVIERDGILASLYYLDLLVKTGKTPSQLLQQLYDLVGPHHFNRIDISFDEIERKAILKRVENYTPDKVCGIEVLHKDTFDGFRYVLHDNSWLLIRFSGTEPLLRIYAEANSIDLVNELLNTGRKITEV